MVFGQQGNGPIGHLLLLRHVSNLGRQTGGLCPCSSIVGIHALKSLEKSSNMPTLVVEIPKRVFISTRMPNFFSPQHIEKLLLTPKGRQTRLLRQTSLLFFLQPSCVRIGYTPKWISLKTNRVYHVPIKWHQMRKYSPWDAMGYPVSTRSKTGMVHIPQFGDFIGVIPHQLIEKPSKNPSIEFRLGALLRLKANLAVSIRPRNLPNWNPG